MISWAETALNNNLHLKTYTDLAQLNLSDNNSLQEICNVLPETSAIYAEVGAKPAAGWKSQLPEGMGLVVIEKYYISRVIITFYPVGGGYFYRAAFTSSLSPSLRSFYKFTGTAV